MTPTLAIFLLIAGLALLTAIIAATPHPQPAARPTPNPRCPPREWELQRDQRMRAEARAAQISSPGAVVTIHETEDGLAYSWGAGEKGVKR